MNRGVVLIAHNNEVTNYYNMAVYTASRIRKFLDLPVSVITDEMSIGSSVNEFDNVYLIEPDDSNYRGKNTWLNKGRYQVYNFTPYDDTLVLDTDYMINSAQLLETFKYSSDFVCHNNSFTLFSSSKQEVLSAHSAQTLWATVMRFRKTYRVKYLFQVIQHVQENYQHYSNIHKFSPYMYRNDYALTIALRIVNGHYEIEEDYLRWKLFHIGLDTTITRLSDVAYLALKQNTPRSEWVLLNNIDFHVINKKNFEELSNV